MGIDVDAPEYTSIKVDFWFYANSMELGEDFWIQYYDGLEWLTVADYDQGIDFENNQFYHEIIWINESWYTFHSDMKIRFKCDASNNDDDIYIDQIYINATNVGSPIYPIKVYVDDDYNASTPGWDIDHFNEIQDGVNAVDNNGSVLVNNGLYTEEITIMKSIKLIGQDKYNTLITNDNGATIRLKKPNIFIENFSINNTDVGHTTIGAHQDYLTIKNNIISSTNSDCIRLNPYLTSSISNLTIVNNYFHESPNGVDCSPYGPANFNTFNLTIINNTFYNNNCGIWIDIPYTRECRYTNISQNTFVNCSIFYYQENNINSMTKMEFNFVNGKPLIFLDNQSNITIYTPSGQIIMSECDNITILNQNFLNATNGILLSHSNNCLIKNNLVFNNWYGIFMMESNNITYQKNTIDNNNVGLHMNGDNNEFFENNITNNSFRSVELGGNHNLFYHNNFINNTGSVRNYGENTSWNINYPIGGNYWDDYLDEDLYYGPYQDILGSDGFGDLPYTNFSYGDTVDQYPLMQPWNGTPLSIPEPITVYVDDNCTSSTPGWQYDHFNVIQDGIDAVAKNGTVYVFNGTYYENVVVNKTIDLFGIDDSIITMSEGEDYGIFIDANYVNISGFIIGDYSTDDDSTALMVWYSDYVNIYNNTLVNNSGGIHLAESEYCNVFNNNIIHNGFGVGVSGELMISSGPGYNCIENNTINSTLADILISPAKFTSVKNNILTKGLYINGGKKSSWNTHTIENNTINGKTIKYLKNESNVTISSTNISQVILGNCSNITIESLILENIASGIQIGFSTKNTIKNNTIKKVNFESGININYNSNYNNIMNNYVENNDYCGIDIFESTNNIIANNQITNNQEFGVNIFKISSYNQIYNNTITNNRRGINIDYSSDNIVDNNIIEKNIEAILLDSDIAAYPTENNIISNNLIINNSNGIILEGWNTEHNEIRNNQIINTTEKVISITDYAKNQVIFHNVFLENDGFFYADTNNTWDNGYPSGGNYWDNYNGTDADGDGIGDKPYNISGGSNQDMYPLGYFHPIANFTYSPSNPIMLSRVYFTDTSIDPDGNITSWFWDFGEGDTSTEQHPSNIFVNEGNYTVCLTVTDDDGKNHTYCQIINVSSGLDVNQSSFNRGFPIRHAVDGDWAGAQSFTLTMDTLTRVEIILRKFGTPEFNLSVELRTDHPKGSLIDSRTYTPDQVSSNWEMFEVNFNDTTVQNDTDYFIVIPPAPSGVTTSFGYEWGYAFGNQYDNGSFWFTRDGGGLWRDLPTMYEFAFKTYGYI